MKISIYLWLVVMLWVTVVAAVRGMQAAGRGEVHSLAPPSDPQVLFLLMAEYSNANLQSAARNFSPRG